MVLWFVGTSLVAMRWFFGDAAMDHRLVLAGALAPDAVHVLSGGAALAHSLVLPVCTLVAVMLITIGRRRARRRWLGGADRALLASSVRWRLDTTGTAVVALRRQLGR